MLFRSGFQLSFAAVGAIFTVAPPILRRLEGYPLPEVLRNAIAISTACGIVTGPILLLQFSTLPLLAVPANALAEPAMPVLLALAFATTALAVVAPSAATVVAWLNGWVAWYIALCAHAVGSLPFAQAEGTPAALVLVCSLGVAAYAWLRWRRR